MTGAAALRSLRTTRGHAWLLAALPGLLIGLAIVTACSGKRAEPPAAVVDPTALRTPPAGPVQGFRSEYGAHVWRGIPYAQPPVGALRWRAPQTLAAWQAPRDALAFGASCVQYASSIGDDSAEPGTPVGSEDCLFLNIYAPAFEASTLPQAGARLPVMLWIHGGGNSIGSASSYDGGNLAATQGVVVVTLNYRLGPFGWFRHPALARDATPAEQSGNFALLDLVHALGWVQQNIAAFGGDPENVTIFGESAGARNVVQLLVSPLARGLFQRAIAQSGGTRSNTLAEAQNYASDAQPGHRNSSREVALRLLAPAQQDVTRAHWKLDELTDAQIEEKLRAIPATTVLNAYPSSGRLGLIDMPQVIRDGVVLPDEELPLRFASADGVAQVPVMFGTNHDENKLFLLFDPKYARTWFGIPSLRDPERFQLTAEYQSRNWKAFGADELAIALTEAGRQDVYVYRWDWDEEPKVLWVDLGNLLGASHGLEIPFVFGHWNLGRIGEQLYDDENLPGRQALSAAMMSYWAEFARSGAPGRGRRGDLPLWSAWSAAPDGDKFIVLDTEQGGGLRMSREVVTSDALLAELTQDPRLADAAQRCNLLANLVEWSPSFDESDYAASGCDGSAKLASQK